LKCLKGNEKSKRHPAPLAMTVIIYPGD